jgi:hypothetical protein
VETEEEAEARKRQRLEMLVQRTSNILSRFRSELAEVMAEGQAQVRHRTLPWASVILLKSSPLL